MNSSNSKFLDISLFVFSFQQPASKLGDTTRSSSEFGKFAVLPSISQGKLLDKNSKSARKLTAPALHTVTNMKYIPTPPKKIIDPKPISLDIPSNNDTFQLAEKKSSLISILRKRPYFSKKLFTSDVNNSTPYLRNKSADRRVSFRSPLTDTMIISC